MSYYLEPLIIQVNIAILPLQMSHHFLKTIHVFILIIMIAGIKI